MTTPTEDPGPLSDIEQALATLKAAILQYFESNPLDEAHQRLDDKDELHTQVLARIQQQSNVSAQAVDAYSASGTQAQRSVSSHGARSTHARSHPASAPHAGATQAHQPAAASAKGSDDPAFSGARWAKVFPSLGNDTAHLDPDFGAHVDEFIAAMREAGIEVHVAGARRSPERAYLMHWSYRIFKEGTSAEEADQDGSRPAGVGIRWAHVDKDGKYDPKASKQAAEALYHALGVSATLAVEPSLKSLHIRGLAVDMTTTWKKDSITIRKADGSEVVIKTTSDGERTDNNSELHKVAESYGVIHFASEKGVKSLPAGDANHWSYNGH